MADDEHLIARAQVQQNRLAVIEAIIGSIVHHWQQPLNTVALILQNIQADFHSGTLTCENVDTDIDEAMKEIFQLSRAIAEFRDYFRVDNEPQDFNINAVVDCALSLLGPILRKNRIKVKFKAAAEVTARGSKNEFLQVLLNILLNSMAAASERTITHHSIYISISREQSCSIVSIRDNCGNIAADLMPEIFEPFFPSHSPGSGAGLGLYASRIIIEQNMGGRLTARNMDGGTEFRIEI